MTGQAVHGTLLPRRLGSILKAAAKVRGASAIRIHRQTDRELELISQGPTTDEELAESNGFGAIALVESLQLVISDDLGSLPPSGEPAVYIVTIVGDEGRELARDRIRLKTPKLEAAIEASMPAGPPAGSAGWEANEPRSPSAQVMQAAIIRQQYRHNEAMAASIVKSFAGTIEKTTGLISTLSGALETSLSARARDAEQSIAVARAARTMEAEARAEEMRGEALKITAGTIAEWLPVALHKIARKYGMSGDDAIDPMLEKMVLSFKSEQLEGLAGVLSPVQQQMLGELYCTVKDRVAAREKEKKAAAEKTAAKGATIVTSPEKAIVEAGAASVGRQLSSGGNGAGNA